MTGESQEKDLYDVEEEEEEDKSEQDEDEQDYEDQASISTKRGQKGMSKDIASEKIHSLRNMVQTLQQQGKVWHDWGAFWMKAEIVANIFCVNSFVRACPLATELP